MVIVRLPDGSLQLHSPGPLDSSLRAEIDQNGRVSSIIVPSNFHDTFVAEALTVYPSVDWYAPPNFPAIKVPRPPRSFADAPDWGPVLRWQAMAGIPKIGEHVFLHVPSRTLMVADLVFNIESHADAWTRLFFRLNGALNVLRPTRMFRSCIKDRAAFEVTVEEIFQWDFDRLVPCHGQIVETGAKARLRNEFKF
jgi:hypothetical protein